MPRDESAAGVVVYFQESAVPRLYLVIQHAAGHWEFPKGHIEPGETWRQTALRELGEETAIADGQLIEPFARQIRYIFRDRKNRLIRKTVCFGLVRTPTIDVGLSHEHLQFEFLNYAQARIRLTHAGTRAVLDDAEKFLQ